MKVLFYINILSGGGAERVLTNVANYFVSQGHETVVVNTFYTPNEYPLDKQAKHIYLETEEKAANFWVRNYQRIKKLRKVLKKEKPDVAISFMTEPNFRLIMASAGLKNKTLVSLRINPEYEDKGIRGKFFLRVPFQCADGVVFQTEHAHKYFGKRVERHSRVIVNPVNSLFYGEPYEGERKNIVTAGRLCAQKNQLMLIDAFSRLANETQDNLLIYGDGDYKELLQKRIDELGINDRIFLMGNESKLYEKLKSAKLFVFPSDFEGLPNALMEAMALGLPAISTDCDGGGARMLLDHGKNGYLIPKRDTDALEKIMREVLALSSEEREKIGAEARKTAEGFRYETIAKKWEDYALYLSKK